MKKNLEILCIADHVDPLIYSESLVNRFGHVDAVLSCGDLESDYYEFIVSNLNIPMVYVLGNHSHFSLKNDHTADFEMDNLFCGGLLADGKSVYLKKIDLLIVGFGGSIKYNNRDNQYSETEMFLRILKLIPALLMNRLIHGRFLDIFLTHAPPSGVNDKEDPCHRGFKIFRWFIRVFKPSYMIHGHIHLYGYDSVRESIYEGVPVINAYEHYILKLSQEQTDD